MVESQPSKLLVAGSIPVSRSKVGVSGDRFFVAGVKESEIGVNGLRRPEAKARLAEDV